jgi:hypothetical protein
MEKKRKELRNERYFLAEEIFDAKINGCSGDNILG